MKQSARNRTSATATLPSRAAAGPLQAKLSVGRGHDGYEQEADRVASAVAGGARAPAISRLASRGGAAPAQRQAEEGDAVQAKSEQRTAEDEKKKALRKAPAETDEKPPRVLQRQAEAGEEEGSAEAESVETEVADEEAQAKAEPHAARDRRAAAPPRRVAGRLAGSRGSGAPLEPVTRAAMERSFGADFAAVRVHTGSDAVAMARDLKAQAFTRGRDVYFNAGKFEPGSVRGKTLLAHELTHVVQQGAAAQKQSATQARGEGVAVPASAPARVPESGAAPELAVAGPAAASGVGGPSGVAASAAPTPAGPKAGGEAAPAGAARGPAPAAPEAAVAHAAAAPAPARKSGAVAAFLRRVTQGALAAKQAAAGRLSAAQKTKSSAASKLAQTERAVAPPAGEGESRARAGQVEAVDRAPAPAPDAGAARARFDAALSGAVPATLEDMDRFKEQGKGRRVGQAVREVVTADAQAVEGTYGEIENAPAPQAPEAAPEALPPVEAAPETPALDMGEGVVGATQPEHGDLSDFDRQSDGLLAQEEIKAEQLEMVDEGDLAEAKRDRQSLKDTVRQAPSGIKAFEQAQQQQVGQTLHKEEQEGRRAMGEARQRELHGARARQSGTKSALEARREAVAARINALYENANAAVRQKLADLEKKSLAAFDEGQQRAAREFEDNVKRRMDAFKARRYDVLGGSLLWAKDKLFGMEDLPEVAEIFADERARFVAAVDGLVTAITAQSRRVVQECRDLVAAARKEIEKFVRGLGPELRKTGQEALKDMQGRLAALDRQIDAKAEELKKALAARREAAIKAIDDKIAKMKEEMSGLVAKLGGLLLNAAVKFFAWALKKAGYASEQLMGIINKGKEVIRRIVTDPIGFIRNLVQAVKDGIGLFWGNIKKHLVAGLMKWLTGALADVPIQLPDKWDLKGILHLILQILGLTWASIRAKLVKRLGEKAVRIAETTVGIVKRLVTEGPLALWEMLKEKAAEIKQQVMEGIRSWAIFELVKQGIVKLVSFLNPAGAIAQAILAIYNTIMFFVENWERIVEFVKSVLNSIADIALGRLAAAAALVERALGMTIPIILGFLARLLGLSGIGKTIAAIIKKIRKPIDKVVNKAIGAIVKAAKKLLKKVGKMGRKLKEKVVAWWKSKVKFKAKDGAKHTTFIRKSGKRVRIMVASKKTELGNYLALHEKAHPAEVAQAKTVFAAESQYVFGPAPNKDAKKVVGALRKISNALAKIGGGVDDSLLPAKDEVEWKGKKAKPGKVSVDKLTYKNTEEGTEPGTGPETKVTGWKRLHEKGLTKDHPQPSKHATGNWVQMHLINRKLGGKGEPHNLVPGPGSINSGFMRSFEQKVLSLVARKAKNKHNVVWVSSDVAYHSGKLKSYASGVAMKAGIYAFKGKKADGKGTWAKINGARLSADVSLPKPELNASVRVISLNHTSKSVLGEAFDTLHKYERDAIQFNRPYASKGDFLKKISKDLAARRGAKPESAIEARFTDVVAKHLNAEFDANGTKYRLTLDRTT